jgi:Flp pilus assembly pilin Flp
MLRIGSRRFGFRRNKWGRLFLQITKDERGIESVEVALSIALIAAVAGFGMVFLGEAVGNWFVQAGNDFTPGAAFPSQPSVMPGGAT